MTITTPALSKIFASDNALRRSLMVTLALIMTHLISYQKLPFTENYRFPAIHFGIFVIYGIFICEINTRNYRKLAGEPGFQFDWKGIRRMMQINLVSCTLIFTVLTIGQMLIFQSVMNAFRFAGLLGVCLMISVLETGVFIVHTLLKQRTRKPVTLNRLASEKKELTILRNNELLTFREEDIAYLIHENGCIILVAQNGNRLTTQFDTLSEVESRLTAEFFRVTRQVLVSRKAIHSVKKDVNQKLKLQISYLKGSLTVSRYRCKDFKDWYKG